MPENFYLSVTVCTESSALADALSTAIFNMTEAEAQAVIDAVGQTEVTIVRANGEVVVLSSQE